MITLRLQISNDYEDGTSIETESTITVPAPASVEAGSDELWDWAGEYLWPETGTGITAGDAYYEVLIVDSSDPELVGFSFEFGG